MRIIIGVAIAIIIIIIVVFVAVGVGAEDATGVATGAEPEAQKMEPSSSDTSFGGAVLPEKNSAALSAGSADGAGG